MINHNIIARTADPTRVNAGEAVLSIELLVSLQQNLQLATTAETTLTLLGQLKNRLTWQQQANHPALNKQPLPC
jgi:hypothetical protein